jgi:hypothetical protein
MTMSSFIIDGPAGQARIIYNDPRRFGYMDLMARSALAEHPWFRSLGVEPTGNSLDAHELAGRLAGKTAPLKAALLDQRIIAGLGNIYVCEALWRAGLSPVKPAGTLVTKDGTPRRRCRLAEAIPRRHRRGHCRRRLVAEGPYPARTERSAISSIPFPSMTARERLAHGRAVAIRSAASCKRGARHFYCPRMPEIADRTRLPAEDRKGCNKERYAMALKTFLTETRGRVAIDHAEPARCAQRAQFGAAERAARDAGPSMDADEKIGAIVLTGSEKAFAAGADIKEMQPYDYVERLYGRLLRGLERFRSTRKPVDRGGIRLCAGRRLRAGDDVRLHHCRRDGQVRPAGNHPRRHARHGRHAAAGARASARPRRWTCA